MKKEELQIFSGVIGMEGFGASAPGGALMKHFGFTPERIAKAARRRLT